MGKGTITGGGSGGLYNVRLNLSRSRIAAAVARLEAQIAEYAGRIAGLEDGPEKSMLTLKKTAAEKRAAYMNHAMPADPVVEAWSADFTESLSGDVGTIEIPGERVPNQVHIQPGYNGNAAYDASRDGIIEPAIAGTAAGSFFNLALVPAWQRWLPTYRYGTITAVNKVSNTCSLILQAAYSGANGADINPGSRTFDNVPVEYMDRNAAAFETGSEVIVRFTGQRWSSPKVIGFKSHPMMSVEWDLAELNFSSDPDGWELVTPSDYGFFQFEAVCERAVFDGKACLMLEGNAADYGNKALAYKTFESFPRHIIIDIKTYFSSIAAWDDVDCLAIEFKEATFNGTYIYFQSDGLFVWDSGKGEYSEAGSNAVKIGEWQEWRFVADMQGTCDVWLRDSDRFYWTKIGDTLPFNGQWTSPATIGVHLILYAFYIDDQLVYVDHFNIATND